jgi:2,3-bisphosphoglycerate-dependent phosphoglycerate mutase
MKNVLLLLFVTITVSMQAQTITTFVLVRHAEKENDGTKDPELTEAGMKRADLLAAMFKEASVDAIYSTSFKRTLHTVGPLAKEKNQTIQSYEAFKPDELDKMLKKYAGGTIVISGHSNTTPWIANYLTGTQAYKDFDDGDYGNIMIVSVVEKGKIAKVVWLNY